jgi:D-threonate/D-erythronate kinase
MRKRFVVVADDFTGANDTGVQFRKAGLKVNVVINTDKLIEEMNKCDVLVVDLESRFDLPAVAYRKCYSLGEQLLKENVLVYKKLDSTFRGNIGAEIDGLMDSLKLKITFLAPAFPASGRVTENGMIYVNGVLLAESEFANDPRSPVTDSKIKSIIGRQSRKKCQEISADIFKRGNKKGHQFLSREILNNQGIFVFDSRTENDLENIARSVELIIDQPYLLAGSAGFANHLRNSPLILKNQLCFVFAGSVKQKSIDQVKYALDVGHCKLELLDGKKLLNDDFNISEIKKSVSDSIASGKRRFIFTAALSVEDVEKVFLVAAKKSLSKDAAAQKIAFNMGHLAADMIQTFKPSGALLTGGEIAINTVNALHATGISIDQELFPGVQSGTLSGCEILTVIATKAGGFGERDSISKTFEYFKV